MEGRKGRADFLSFFLKRTYSFTIIGKFQLRDEGGFTGSFTGESSLGYWWVMIPFTKLRNRRGGRRRAY